jgi:tetratricopeptide (TPR) repeat protein
MKTFPTRGLLVLLAAFCFFCTFATAQSVSRDTAFIDELYAKSRNYWRKKDDSSYYYLKQVEDLSRKINYKRGIANALYGYGINEPVLYKQFQYFTQSLEIFESIHDQFGIGINLVKIGSIYRQIGHQEKALEYYRRSLSVKNQIDDFGGIALTLINIGKYYQTNGLLAEALQYFEEALAYRLKEGTHQGIAYAQVNLAEVLLAQHKMDNALIMADSAVRNFSLTNDLTGQVWALNLKGKCLLQLNRPAEAEKIFQTVSQYPGELKYNHDVLAAKHALIQMFSNQGELKKAFDMQAEYLIAKDTLASRDYRIETQRMVNDYEFKLAEQRAQREQLLMEQQIARRNNLEYLSISVMVLVLFVILFSRGRKLSNRVVNSLLLIGLLLLFEFLLILTDSSIEGITRGEPILKLLANVTIALLILPGHQFLERFTRKRLQADSSLNGEG